MSWGSIFELVVPRHRSMKVVCVCRNEGGLPLRRVRGASKDLGNRRNEREAEQSRDGHSWKKDEAELGRVKMLARGVRRGSETS